MDKPTMFMMVGLPASGKSTYAIQLAEKISAMVFSSDDLRREMFGDVENQDNNQKLFQELHKRIKDCLKSGNNAIYDATNISSKRRRSFLNELKSIDCRKQCIIMVTPYEQCLENNKNRDRVVPEWVIKNMYMKWQTPHQFEGFDVVSIKYWDNKHFVFPFEIANSLIDFDQQNYHHSLTLGEHLYKTHELCKCSNFNVLSACLMHDCGKPFTKTFESYKGELSDTAHYYGHEHISAYESLFILPQGINPIEVSALVTWHMQPYFWERDNNEKLHNKYKKIWGEEFYNELVTLHEADKAAHQQEGVLMIQIRSNVFETNSSSTHSICIPKKTKTTMNYVDFGLGEFGWENSEADPASYLYTAILCGYDYDEAMEKLDRLTDILNRHDIAYRFEKPKWEFSRYDGHAYLSYDSGYVDHAYETNELVETLLDDEDMLLRYLSEGAVYTGNDNQDADYSGCNIADAYMYDWETGKESPNPYHDEKNFDYFYKGN